MNEAALLQQYLIVGSILFGLGLSGFLIRRNLITVFLCAEMMLQGVSLVLIAWGRFHDDWGGQFLVLFIIAIAACEAGIALVLVLLLCQWAGNLDIANWQWVREPGLVPYVDREVPEEVEPTSEPWPVLTTAGTRPDSDPQETMFRTHV
jgi:NADH-quinone oxidoreductase subunit K